MDEMMMVKAISLDAMRAGLAVKGLCQEFAIDKTNFYSWRRGEMRPNAASLAKLIRMREFIRGVLLLKQKIRGGEVAKTA